MIFVIDACSVILLAKATVLEKLLEWRKIKITKGALKEVLEGKEKKFFDALIVDRLKEEGKINVVMVKNKRLLTKLKEDYGLGDGEAETLAFFIENKAGGIITDNKQGRKIAKIYGIPLIGSLDVIVALFKGRIINKNKAINAIDLIRKYGWFEDSFIDQAKMEVENA